MNWPGNSKEQVSCLIFLSYLAIFRSVRRRTCFGDRCSIIFIIGEIFKIVQILKKIRSVLVRHINSSLRIDISTGHPMTVSAVSSHKFFCYICVCSVPTWFCFLIWSLCLALDLIGSVMQKKMNVLVACYIPNAKDAGTQVWYKK
jgi:hypothetical protein